MPPPAWAYEFDLFQPEPDDELVCCICQNVLCDPVFTRCGHGFCKRCITSWLATKKTCPICRKVTIQSRLIDNIIIVKNMISKLKLRCHNFERGCKEILTLEACESHAESCDYEVLPCINSPACTDVIPRKDFNSHVENCFNVHLPCDTCKRSIPPILSGKHDCNMVDISLLFDASEWSTIFWYEGRNMTVDQFRAHIRRRLKEKEEAGRRDGHPPAVHGPVCTNNVPNSHVRNNSAVNRNNNSNVNRRNNSTVSRRNNSTVSGRNNSTVSRRNNSAVVRRNDATVNRTNNCAAISVSTSSSVSIVNPISIVHSVPVLFARITVNL